MSFWKAAALLVVGGYVALEANKYLKNKLFPTTSEEVDEVEVKPKVQNTKKTSKEIEEIKELIKEYESKKHKTKRELGILDLLRFKLNQLEKELQTVMDEWMTISQILEGAFDEVSFYYKAKRVRLNFGKFTVSICGSSTSDIFYGNFVDTFEIAIIDSTTKNFVTRNFLGGPHDVISYATVDQVEEIVNIFTGAPSPKKRVVERLTTS